MEWATVAASSCRQARSPIERRAGTSDWERLQVWQLEAAPGRRQLQAHEQMCSGPSSVHVQ